ncbi:MAG: D-2-hydroxyacid dehydrogenase [Chloroflexi bacterium]|nr:D-2-hydroxyacid dehydrogenase [Chloroflexota bacterium]
MSFRMMMNVLVSKAEMHESFLKEIEAVDPSIAVRDVTGLLAQELRLEGLKDGRVRRLEEEARLDLARGADPGTRGESLDSLLAEAEIMFAWALAPENLMSRAPRLKWFHFSGVGVERYIHTDMFDGRITVTNGRGALATPIAEHVTGFIFTLAKNVPRLCQAKADKRWERFETLELTGRTLGVIGMGAIGSELTRMAKGVGMRVIATRRSAVKHEYNVGYVDDVYPIGALLDLLRDSDFVALALPLTQESRKLIGERELRSMKRSAYIINVSRGQIIDERALLQALKEGWIAGAGLDVFDEEPIATDSQLWKLPNVVLSPHMAGNSDRRSYHVSRVFFDNLRRYISGQPLLNIVTRDRGY